MSRPFVVPRAGQPALRWRGEMLGISLRGRRGRRYKRTNRRQTKVCGVANARISRCAKLSYWSRWHLPEPPRATACQLAAITEWPAVRWWEAIAGEGGAATQCSFLVEQVEQETAPLWTCRQEHYSQNNHSCLRAPTLTELQCHRTPSPAVSSLSRYSIHYANTTEYQLWRTGSGQDRPALARCPHAEEMEIVEIKLPGEESGRPAIQSRYDGKPIVDKSRLSNAWGYELRHAGSRLASVDITSERIRATDQTLLQAASAVVKRGDGCHRDRALRRARTSNTENRSAHC